MNLVLDPYELSARSPAAMAALLLAGDEGGVLTLRPSPAGGNDELPRLPWLARLLDEWRWSSPLWRAGVLVAELGSRPLFDELQRLLAEVAADPALAELRGIVHPELAADLPRFVEALSRDLIRGGDPGVHLGVSATLERIAGISKRMLVLGEGTMRPPARDPLAARFSMPVVTGVGGGAILDLRKTFAEELHILRAAVGRCMDELIAGATSAESRVRLSHASEAFLAAFQPRKFQSSLAEETQGGRIRAHGVVISLERAACGSTLLAASRAVTRFSGGAKQPSEATNSLALAPYPVVIARVRPSPWDLGAQPSSQHGTIARAQHRGAP